MSAGELVAAFVVFNRMVRLAKQTSSLSPLAVRADCWSVASRPQATRGALGEQLGGRMIEHEDTAVTHADIIEAEALLADVVNVLRVRE